VDVLERRAGWEAGGDAYRRGATGGGSHLSPWLDDGVTVAGGELTPGELEPVVVGGTRPAENSEPSSGLPSPVHQAAVSKN